MANVLLDEAVAAAGWLLPSGLGLLAAGGAGVLRAWCDGGLRPGGAGAAAAVLAWFLADGAPRSAAWPGRACAARASLEGEAAAVARGAEHRGRALRGSGGGLRVGGPLLRGREP